MDWKDVRDASKTLVESYATLRNVQRDYERHSRVEYSLPESLSRFQWIRPIISTSPFNALRGGQRAMSNLEENLTIHPTTVLKAVGEVDDLALAAREKANAWERALKAELSKSTSRYPSFRPSVIWNALVHDEIVAQVVHLPTQFKLTNPDPARKDAALRYGNWAIRLLDPQQVYVDYSDMMAERVLGVRERTAKDCVSIWGTKEIEAKIKKDPDHAAVTYLEFDCVDYEGRWVWLTENTVIEQAVQERGIEVLHGEPWLEKVGGGAVPFLPWVAVIGGTLSDELPEHRRKPLLYAVVKAEQWANANIMLTLQMSQAIAEAGSPRDVFKGPGSENVIADYGEPGGRIDLNPMQEYQRIQAVGLDPQLTESYDRIENAISRTAVAEVLVTGSPTAGTETFSAYNLQLQTAIASLGPYKALGEKFYEDLYEKMLLITHYTGGEIVGYGEGVEKYKIDSEDIDPKAISLSVELKMDVPADRTQRIIAATNMAQSLTYPTTKILEFLGENDPEGAMELWKLEQMDKAELQGIMKRIEMETSGELQQMAMQIAQAMMQQQQEQMAQQQMMQQAPQQGGSPPNMMNPPGMEGVGGQGFNPAMGGMVPAEANPMANTFEGQRGASRGGQELAGF